MAGTVTITIVAGALLFAGGSDPKTLGADRDPGIAARSDPGAPNGPFAGSTPRLDMTGVAAAAVEVDASASPDPTARPESRGLPWGWGSTGVPSGDATAVDPGPSSSAVPGAAASPRPGAKPPSGPPTSKEPEELSGYG